MKKYISSLLVINEPPPQFNKQTLFIDMNKSILYTD